MAKNADLNKASVAKKDEFYTQLTDIEKEMRYYTEHFKGKTIFCNCDDPETSNFWLYFELNFEKLGIKKLIATHYETDKPSYKLELMADIDGDGKVSKRDIIRTTLKQNGDFRSPECIDILKEADIVITNPPFSLFREFVATLMEYNKKFIIIGNMNALHYKEIFPLIQDNKMWLGISIRNGDREFRVPDSYHITAVGFRIGENGEKYIRVKGVRWYTNLETKHRHEYMILYKTYTPDAYPTYTNFDAIDVDKVADVPIDYYGIMGVPDTFIQEYNPEQFEIIGLGCGDMAKTIGIKKNHRGRTDLAYLFDGVPKCPYSRILIRRKDKANED
ncbi:MAG TPA: adenine-specific methyltransferase EcoRI family protein [Candidatus Limiplasma sp.]|nr:adenine-specific methyltransferase EcoRI family protein [Candidatus Limiplasma sp.]